MDLTAFHVELEKIQAYIDSLVSVDVVVPDPSLEDDIGDVVINALFCQDGPTCHPLLEAGKHTWDLEHTIDMEEEKRARKKEKKQLDSTQRQKLLEEEMWQLIEKELVISVSGSRGTIDGSPLI